MRKVLSALLLPTLAAMILFAGGAVASNSGVPRYQVQSGVLTVTLDQSVYPGNIHAFDITINPCDGSFTGVTDPASPVQRNEAIAGTLSPDGSINFTSQYGQPVGITNPYIWFGSGPMAAFSGGSNMLPVNEVFTNLSATVAGLTDASNYKNHGEYVSTSADKNDAAHSCIGMPISSNK